MHDAVPSILPGVVTSQTQTDFLQLGLVFMRTLGKEECHDFLEQAVRQSDGQRTHVHFKVLFNADSTH